MKPEPGPSPTPEAEAWEQLQFYTLGHAGSEFIHQHVVDAWTAQHAGEGTKPIALTFALVGLYLRVEKGFSGRQVQRIHMNLAATRRSWPSFALPERRGAMTVIDVMSAPAGHARDQAIDAWCAAVWAPYTMHRESIADLLRACGQHVPGGRGGGSAR